MTKKKSAKKSTAAKKTTTIGKKTRASGSSRSKAESIALLKTAPERKFPRKLRPMLATLVDKPFDDAGWIYEVKWDGYRALGFVNMGKVELKSRNDKSFNDKFYPVKHALAKWRINAVVDGEVVVLREDGVSHFGDLQNWRSEADGELYYYVFDILWYNGKDLTRMPLVDRKTILKAVFAWRSYRSRQ